VSQLTALVVLLFAALVEVRGDALVRLGLRVPGPLVRLAFFVSGGVTLFAYRYAVNAPAWDFGRLLGIYAVFVFPVAQLMSWLVFAQPPSRATLGGGAFVLLGGAIMSTWSG